jgi:hypothetical protein
MSRDPPVVELENEVDVYPGQTGAALAPGGEYGKELLERLRAVDFMQSCFRHDYRSQTVQMW